MHPATEIEEAIFETALSLDEPETRRAFLDQTFASDPGGRNRMEDLLEAARGSVEFFLAAREQSSLVADEILDDVPVNPPPRPDAQGASPDEPGARIGRYRLIERIGEGACGVVYEAEQVEPVRRRVALKIIRLGMDTEGVIRRFQSERQTLALMDHPHIAHVLDAGATTTGRPFFVMELVHGERITAYCDARQLDLPARLALFLDVCEAIQHAHQKGIIHRDIKPSNILVDEDSAVAAPKVIDFGIAKATRSCLADQPEFTARDQFLGTPAYMSPEQVDLGGGLDIDSRSDVYSLGVLLYELLSGHTPFNSDTLLNSGMVEMRRTILEDLPPLCSAFFAGLPPPARAAIARRRRLDPKRLAATLRGDLDWIVAMALEKDRNRRYQTVGALTMDLRRFLDCQPVTARPPSRLYLFSRFVRRNRVACLSTLAVVVSLAVGMGASVHMFVRERHALREQRRLTTLTEHMAAREQSLRMEAEQMRAEEQRLRQNAAARQAISQTAILWALARNDQLSEQFSRFPQEIIDPTPEEAILFQELGGWNAGCDRWHEALWCFKVSMERESPAELNSHLVNLNWPKSGPATLMACPVTVMTGSLADYDELRRTLLARFGQASWLIDVDHVLRASLLTPADPTLLAGLQPLAERLAAALESGDLPSTGEPVHWFPATLALFEYRRGNDDRGLTLATRVFNGSQRRPERDSLARCVAALVHLRQNDPATAARHIAAARKLVDHAYRFAGKRPNRPVDRKWFDWAITRILLAEAQTGATPAPLQPRAGRDHGQEANGASADG